MMPKRELKDYKVIRKIGEGSFGEILEVQLNNAGNLENYAMKKLSQKQLVKLDKIHEAFIEREILLKLKQICPEFFVGLYETHNDSEYIYMILELCEAGSLDSYISKLKNLPNKNQVIKRIIIKMVLALEALHSNGVIHRDLKPSNFLFRKDGHLKLADFGTAYANEGFFSSDIAQKITEFKEIAKKKKKEKMGEDEDSVEMQHPEIRRATFVGTPLYMAPELLSEDFCGPEADLWALGCIIYELIHSKPPFYDENEGMVWKKILNEDFSSKQLSTTQQLDGLAHYDSLIKALLVKDRTNRLGYGNNGYAELRKHAFFEGIDWAVEKAQPVKEISQLMKQNEELSMMKSKSSQKEEKIIFSGVVNKKMFIGFKERMLTLRSTPKLEYYDMETGEKKGQILLNKETPITTEGNKIFNVTNAKKTYVFKSLKAQDWVEMIKSAIVGAYY